MRIVQIILFSLLSSFVYSQAPTIRWQSAATITRLMQTEKKPVLVDVYTDWCHYCHLMDSTTYKNDTVVNFINTHFYCFRLNAETPDEIKWLGKPYHYLPRYKVHELAVFLTSGNIVYPSTVLISMDNTLKSFGGYLTVEEMLKIVK